MGLFVFQTSSVYGYISGRGPESSRLHEGSVVARLHEGSVVARLHEPLQLRGPNTATVYSNGHSSDAKQKDQVQLYPRFEISSVHLLPTRGAACLRQCKASFRGEGLFNVVPSNEETSF